MSTSSTPSPSGNIEQLAQWPEGIDVIVAPGIPGQDLNLDTGEQPYPEDTVDVMKLLREHGLHVAYLDTESPRAIVAFKGLDYWLPVLIFANNALANGAGTILAQILMNRIGLTRLTSARLRVKIGKREDPDGSVTWLVEADGPAEDVIRAMDSALQGGERRLLE